MLRADTLTSAHASCNFIIRGRHRAAYAPSKQVWPCSSPVTAKEASEWLGSNRQVTSVEQITASGYFINYSPSHVI